MGGTGNFDGEDNFFLRRGRNRGGKELLEFFFEKRNYPAALMTIENNGDRGTDNGA